MRIHNIIKTVCLAGSLALLSACEDWLEIEPKDRFGDTTAVSYTHLTLPTNSLV